uniref:Uncharacterized protein n=1 Tax=Arundo donax TaxID=35708 RepID=A0A0A9HC70_ARUDO
MGGRRRRMSVLLFDTRLVATLVSFVLLAPC